MKKKPKINTSISELSAYLLGALVAFFLTAFAFVEIWDWTVEPLFRAPAAPFTSGIGVALLISIVIAFYELLKER